MARKNALDEQDKHIKESLKDARKHLHIAMEELDFANDIFEQLMSEFSNPFDLRIMDEAFAAMKILMDINGTVAEEILLLRGME